MIFRDVNHRSKSVLFTQILKLGKIELFLDKALQSPSSESLTNAVRSLTELASLFVSINQLFSDVDFCEWRRRQFVSRVFLML